MAINPVSIKIVGVGGIGTWLVHALANVVNVHAPESVLTLVDGDNFEAKNKERQLFEGFGNKAVSVAKTLREGTDRIFINSLAAWVVSDDTAANDIDAEEEAEGITKITAVDLLEDGDIVILCVDNFACRKIIFDAAMNLDNIDIFTGGNGSVEEGDQLFGSVYHFRRRDGRNVTANPAEYHPEFENPADRNPGELSCAERLKLEGGSQVVSANMTVAAIILAKFSQTILEKDLTKIQQSLDHAEIYFDWDAGKADFGERPPVVAANTENADRVAVSAATK